MWRRKPRAAARSPLLKPATITIDIENRRIDVNADLKARMAKGFTPPEPKYRHGAYAKYAKLVHSASDGAVTSFPFD
jgi:dihydroxy-acid dehydratase